MFNFCLARLHCSAVRHVLDGMLELEVSSSLVLSLSVVVTAVAPYEMIPFMSLGMENRVMACSLRGLAASLVVAPAADDAWPFGRSFFFVVFDASLAAASLPSIKAAEPSTAASLSKEFTWTISSSCVVASSVSSSSTLI